MKHRMATARHGNLLSYWSAAPGRRYFRERLKQNLSWPVRPYRRISRKLLGLSYRRRYGLRGTAVPGVLQDREAR